MGGVSKRAASRLRPEISNCDPSETPIKSPSLARLLLARRVSTVETFVKLHIAQIPPRAQKLLHEIRATLITCNKGELMTNLTITVDEQVLKKARMRALEEDTSVNAVLREYLKDYADADSGLRLAVDRVLAASRESKSGSGGRTWKREDLYEERLGRYEHK